MNYKKIKNISKVFLLGTILLGSGCSGFLNEQDPSNLQPSSFYKTPEQAEAALAAVYADTRFICNDAGIFSFNWQMLEAVTGISTTETGQNSDLNNLYGLAFDANNRHVTNWWIGLYHVIANANMVLDRVPGITPMDENQKKRILGEAQFLRAWAYFYAVRIWGDVPLTLKPQTASSTDFLPARTPIKDVYAQIVADLKAAEVAGLPWTDATGRVSTAAVKAELARVYLTMAGEPLKAGASYYQMAADKANEIITNPGSINLFASYGDLHNPDKKNTVEHLFQVQFLGTVQSNNYMQMALLPNFKPITALQAQMGSTVPTMDFFNSYENGDLRTKNQIGFFYSSYFKDGYGAPLDLGSQYIFKHFDAVAHGSQNTPGTAISNQNLTQIRFSEVLLTYAEAQNEASGPNAAAINALKRIRDRAQLATPASFTQIDLRLAVWRERWHELCYENITWFDMVRLKKVYNEKTNGFDDFVGHVNLNSNQALQAKHLLFPIPFPEMNNNPNLKPQNTGY